MQVILTRTDKSYLRTVYPPFKMVSLVAGVYDEGGRNDLRIRFETSSLSELRHTVALFFQSKNNNNKSAIPEEGEGGNTDAWLGPVTVTLTSPPVERK